MVLLNKVSDFVKEMKDRLSAREKKLILMVGFLVVLSLYFKLFKNRMGKLNSLMETEKVMAEKMDGKKAEDERLDKLYLNLSQMGEEIDLIANSMKYKNVNDILDYLEGISNNLNVLKMDKEIKEEEVDEAILKYNLINLEFSGEYPDVVQFIGEIGKNIGNGIIRNISMMGSGGQVILSLEIKLFILEEDERIRFTEPRQTIVKDDESIFLDDKDLKDGLEAENIKDLVFVEEEPKLKTSIYDRAYRAVPMEDITKNVEFEIENIQISHSGLYVNELNSKDYEYIFTSYEDENIVYFKFKDPIEINRNVKDLYLKLITYDYLPFKLGFRADDVLGNTRTLYLDLENQDLGENLFKVTGIDKMKFPIKLRGIEFEMDYGLDHKGIIEFKNLELRLNKNEKAYHIYEILEDDDLETIIIKTYGNLERVDEVIRLNDLKGKDIFGRKLLILKGE